MLSSDTNNCFKTVLLLCLLLFVNTAPNAHSSENHIGIEDHELDALHPSQSVYTNQFVIRSSAKPEVLKQIAHKHGFDYVISVSIFIFLLSLYIFFICPQFIH